MKIAVLTSSRADYGIYAPLLNALSQQATVDSKVIAFGMHILKSQGNTVSDILRDGYSVDIIDGMPIGDSVKDIAVGYGKIAQNFAEYWAKNQYHYVFALGDRWEMSAAVQASIPFNQKIAHIHGGETTSAPLTTSTGIKFHWPPHCILRQQTSQNDFQIFSPAQRESIQLVHCQLAVSISQRCHPGFGKKSIFHPL